MSGLMSAIGQGLSAAGYGAGEMYAKSSLLDQQNDAELQRQLRLEEFKTQQTLAVKRGEADIADQQRQQMAARIDAKAGDLADEQLQSTRALIDSGVDDRRPDRTDDMNRSYDAQRNKLKGNLRTQAAEATGDISPKDAASVEYKHEALLYKSLLDDAKLRQQRDIEDQREEGRNARSEARLGTMLEAIDRRAAARDAKGDDKSRMTAMLGVIDNERKALTNEATDTRRLYETELKGAVGPAAKKAVTEKWQPKLDDIEHKRQAADADYEFARNKVGLPSRSASPAPAPAAAPSAAPATPKAPAAAPKAAASVLSTLPTGAKQIGTSGGKPVYQTPDGKKFIQQ